MTEQPAWSSIFATALIGNLIRAGVRDFVVCPGSRSQALALAAAEAERVGAARLHVRVDERSAAFFALGVARETGVPAPVIVTSGGAVANLWPAVIESHEGRVPMLLLTADRPSKLRGSRSNQTTRQAGLFGPCARSAIDLDVSALRDAASAPEAAARQVMSDTLGLASELLAASIGSVGGEPAGPAQLNMQFIEPLSGWPSESQVDFGCDNVSEGQLSAAEFFARMAAARDELLSEHTDSQQLGSTQDVRVGNARKSSPRDAKGHEGYVHEGNMHEVFVHAGYVHEGDSLAVVIAGEGAGIEAETFARNAGLPLLAEVVSNARFGREAITAYATLIDDPQIGGLVERAIVFGHPTLTRQVPSLLAREDVETIVVDPHRGENVDHFNPHGDAHVVTHATVGADYKPASMRRWLGAWVVADRELREARTTVHAPDLEAAKETGYKERNAYARAEVAVKREAISRELLAESIWRATWPHDRLVVAASRLVRVLDHIAAPRRVHVRSNRGLAGIDGTIATALGIAMASQAAENPEQSIGITRVLLGDLALLHDAGSLLQTPGERLPRLQLFVGNDGGGTIFDTLEAAQSAPGADFERVMYTPQQANLEQLALAYGWQYTRVSTRGELENLLTEPVDGPQLVEVPLDR